MDGRTTYCIESVIVISNISKMDKSSLNRSTAQLKVVLGTQNSTSEQKKTNQFKTVEFDKLQESIVSKNWTSEFNSLLITDIDFDNKIKVL